MGEHGTFVPDEWQSDERKLPLQEPRTAGPSSITHETIDDSESDSSGLFDRYLVDHPFDAEDRDGEEEES